MVGYGARCSPQASTHPDTAIPTTVKQANTLRLTRRRAMYSQLAIPSRARGGGKAPARRPVGQPANNIDALGGGKAPKRLASQRASQSYACTGRRKGTAQPPKSTSQSYACTVREGTAEPSSQPAKYMHVQGRRKNADKANRQAIRCAGEKQKNKKEKKLRKNRDTTSAAPW